MRSSNNGMVSFRTRGTSGNICDGSMRYNCVYLLGLYRIGRKLEMEIVDDRTK